MPKRARTDDHVEKIHQAEQLVERVEEAREQLRSTVRSTLGFTGRAKTEGLVRSLRSSGVGWYAAAALCILVIVDQFQGYGFFVLGPEISRALGVSRPALAGLASLKLLAIALASLGMAAYVQRRPRRAMVAVVTAFAWSVMTLATGFVTTTWALLVILLADGASSGSVGAVHPPLLIDSYPPSVRMRLLSLYRGAQNFGSVLAPLMVAVLTGPGLLTWRGTFLVMGLVSLAAATLTVRLRDPGFGKWDTGRAREVIRQQRGHADDALNKDEVMLGFFENVRRLFLIPTIRRMLTAFAVLGMLLVPLNTYLFFFLEERWGMGPTARGLFLAGMAMFGIAGLALFAPRAEALYREDLAALPRIGSWLLAAGVLALAAALFVPVFGLMVVFFGAAFALFGILNPIITAAMLSIIPAQVRPHAAALSGVFLAGVGGFGGILLLGGIDRRFGTTGAIASVAIPGLLAAVVLRAAHRTIDGDVDAMVDAIVESEEIRAITLAGEHLPLLACRDLCFSYAQLQVLFDVRFTVDDGEMVALLGTNGAGKSTLLHAISGLGLPTKGSVRFRGADITYLDPERRLRLGITQIPGGRAVFSSLSVVDNLRLFGYSLGRDRASIDSAIDASFDAFPRLASRRSNLASTLSGGEQQMLGFARALILKPRLLLIDELSLGLAPVVVSELLEMVRRINSAGTAVVLVEQSVNVALSLVDHAYFMEKGEIRFDGNASELVAREDLLRSVFLQGVAKGLGR